MTINKRTERINQFINLTAAFADPVEDEIYHYTSAEGLRGIIENGELWLTNVAFVNDTTECRALQKEKELFTDNELTNEYVIDKWRQFTRDPKVDMDTYIVSFSSGEESLEQWRAYGNYRIGFKANELIKHNFYLFQCVYNRNSIKKWILEKEKLKEWNGKYLIDEYKRVAAFNLIYSASKKYKNKYFEKEKEVRLIVVSHHTWEPYSKSPSMFENDPPIHYRDHPSYKLPVPYVKFFIEDKEEKGKMKDMIPDETARQMKERKLREERKKRRALLPITEILIGPMIHQKEAKLACKILLNDKGYENIKVNVSNIPYRGF